MRRSIRNSDCCDSGVKKLIVLLLCLATVALFSCTKLMLDTDSTIAVAGVVPIVIENFTGGVGASRTIAPTPLTLTNLQNNYTLKISGRSTIREDLLDQVVTVDTNGKSSLTNVPDGSWHLTLTAYPRTGTTTTQVLSGSTVVTVKNGMGNEARFTLSPVEGGEGTINLIINWQLDDRVVVQPNTSSQLKHDLTVTTYLCDVKTGAIVPGTEASMGRQANKNNTNLPVSFTYTGNATANDRTPKPAGIYELVFTIVGGNLPEATSSVEWRDLLYVEPGRENSGIITIPRLMQKPNAPANVTHSKGATFDAWTEVTFNWDGVYNATQYDVEMIEYTTGTHPTSNQTWTTLSNISANIKTSYNAIPNDGNNYAGGTNHDSENLVLSGGLLSGQNSFVLRLRGNGRKYAVRIRSVNAFGDSSWSYFPLLEFPLPAAPAAPSNFSFTTNRYEADIESFAADFSWTDNANNEKGYELQLLKFSSGTTPRTDSDWTARGGAATASGNTSAWKGEVIYSTTGDPVSYVSGGLGENSSRLSIKIKRHAGTIYYAVRIRSYNDGGVSQWVYPPAGSLLMPVSFIASHNAGSPYNTSLARVFDVTLEIIDIPTSTCTYQFGFIFLASGNDTYLNLLKMDSQGARDTEWTRLLNLPANNTSVGRGGQRQVNTTAPLIQQLNTGTPFPFRVRTVIMSGNTAVDYTPWSYYYPPIYHP